MKRYLWIAIMLAVCCLATAMNENYTTTQSKEQTELIIKQVGLANLDTQIKQLNTDILRATQGAQIDATVATAQKLIQDAETAKIENRIKKETADNLIAESAIRVTQAQLTRDLTEYNLFKVDAEINQIREHTKELATRIWRTVEDARINRKYYTQEELRTKVQQDLAEYTRHRLS